MQKLNWKEGVPTRLGVWLLMRRYRDVVALAALFANYQLIGRLKIKLNINLSEYQLTVNRGQKCSSQIHKVLEDEIDFCEYG